MDTAPYISILIPTRNNEKDIIDCLSSIVNLDYSIGQLEVIIWDNNSEQAILNEIKNINYERLEDYIEDAEKNIVLKIN